MGFAGGTTHAAVAGCFARVPYSAATRGLPGERRLSYPPMNLNPSAPPDHVIPELIRDLSRSPNRARPPNHVVRAPDQVREIRSRRSPAAPSDSAGCSRSAGRRRRANRWPIVPSRSAPPDPHRQRLRNRHDRSGTSIAPRNRPCHPSRLGELPRLSSRWRTRVRCPPVGSRWPGGWRAPRTSATPRAQPRELPSQPAAPSVRPPPGSSTLPASRSPPTPRWWPTNSSMPAVRWCGHASWPPITVTATRTNRPPAR